MMRLIRVGFGPFHLGEMPRGMVDEVPAQALDNLLGLKPPPRRAGWARPKPRPPSKAKRQRRH